MYKVIVPQKVRKKIFKIFLPWQKRILLILKELERNPFIGKKLEGRYKGFYSIRIWPYRIIYTIKKKKLIVEVIEIDLSNVALLATPSCPS